MFLLCYGRIKQVGISPPRFLCGSMAEEANSPMETEHVDSQDAAPASPPTPVLKKPAGKSAAKAKAAAKAAAAASSWKYGSKGMEKVKQEEETHAEQGEEEEPEEDPTMEPLDKFAMDTTLKDRSKDFKFKQLLVQNSLPTLLREAYQKTLSMKTGRVAEQRRLVNLALDRKPDGALVLSLDKPELRDVKDISFTCEYFCTLPQ